MSYYPRNFCNCAWKSKKFRTSRGFEPVTWRYRCDICAHNCKDHSSFDFISAVQDIIYFIHNFITHLFLTRSSTSFPGSFISPPQRQRGKKDPGSGWSRASQKVGGDKKQREGDVTKTQFCLSLTHYGRGKFV